LLLCPQGRRPSKFFSEGELTDPHAHLIVTDGFLRLMIEGKIAEVRWASRQRRSALRRFMSVPVCSTVVTRLFQLDRFEYRICVWIVRILTGDHLFHFIHRSWAALDDLRLPVFEGLSASPPYSSFGSHMPSSSSFKGERARQ